MDEDEDSFTQEEIEEISEDDEDWGHLKTREHLGALSSEKLLERIEDDPKHLVYKQYPTSSILIYAFGLSTIGILPILVLVSFLTESDIIGRLEFILNSCALFAAVWGCILCSTALESKLYRVVLNHDGIGTRGEYGDTAIEWEHIEYIDLWSKGNKTVRIEITGNRRNFWVENSLFEKKFTLDVLKQYIPNLECWSIVRKRQWREGIIRYLKSSTNRE